MKLLASAALAAGFLVVPAAHAQVPVRLTIAHADLDLTRPSDVARLDARIAAAARDGCRSPEPIAVGAREAAHACRIKARASAQPARTAALARAQGSALAYAGR